MKLQNNYKKIITEKTMRVLDTKLIFAFSSFINMTVNNIMNDI